MYKIPETLTQDIVQFGTLIDDFHQGKTNPVQFKGTRVPMGIYEQRKNGTYMVRIRCTGGFISPRQKKQVSLTDRQHDSSHVHITTRQEIQIHNIQIDQAKTILPELQEVGLSSKGGGGNTVRNIMVDIHSGISNEDVFDVLPYAVDLTTKLIAEADSFTLPRKLKIAFSTNEENGDFALINDLGFIAKIQDGKRGFKVYLGGSVASNPTLGWELFDFVPEEDLFRVAIAAKRFFNNHGNRKNKHKARIRYIFYKEGADKTLELFHQYFNELKAEGANTYSTKSLDLKYLKPDIETINFNNSTYSVWEKRYVQLQKQAGLASVMIPITGGNTDSETLIRIADFADQFGNDVLRFTPRQQIQLRNIPLPFLGNVYQLLTSLKLETELPLLVNNVISCTGADTCRLGICLSKGAATALRQKLDSSDLPLDEISQLQINISGCPNSCAQQIWSDIGFSGRVGRNERMYPAYSVYAGASKGQQAQIGETLGVVSARDLPQFTTNLLASYLRVKDFYPSFKAYLDKEGKAQIKTQLETFKTVPKFVDDKNYYYDWGSEELFSVANNGPAECSAGLFDMIDVDKNFIRQAPLLLEEEQNPVQIRRILYDVVYASSRMLLITKGAEPKSSADTFDLFIEHFIQSGLINDRFKSLISKALLHADYDFSNERDLVFELGEAVIKLYEGMDDSLQFKTEVQKPTEPNAAVKSDKSLPVRSKDLRGVTCPLNFVKTKIELAGINSGDLLEIWLDDGQPIQNVPGSVRNEGHEITSLQQVENYWIVWIRKA